jgi:hypothetical protein
MSFSTNVASMSDLKSQLEQVKSDLKNSQAWSFSSDVWPEDWTPEDFYTPIGVPKQYMGMLDKEEFRMG